MKIGIAHFNLSAPMGDTRCVGSFATALRRLGHEVIVYTPSFDPALFPVWDGIDVRVIPQATAPKAVPRSTPSGILGKAIRKVQENRRAARTAERIAHELDADLDVLDCHNGYAYKVAPFYRKVNSRARIVWTMHDPPFNYRPKEQFLTDIVSRIPFYVEPWFERRHYASIDEIIVMDERGAEIAKRLGKPRRLLRLGVNYDHFFRPVRRWTGRKNVRLIGVGSLSPYRRFEDIVRAVAELRRRGYDASAVIICRDAWGNKTYRGRFEKMITASGVAGCLDVRFEGASELELIEALALSDMFVFPNHIKIWGMAAFEAMAAGLPLIVSRITSVADMLEDEKNALFVDPLRPDQIVSQVEKAVNDPKLCQSIAEGGQQFVKEHLSWDAYARRYLQQRK